MSTRRELIEALESLAELRRENAALRAQKLELEGALACAGRVGRDEAFRLLDPVFRRIESALQLLEEETFVPLLTAAIEEYFTLVPAFVLEEREYLSAEQAAKVIRIGRDRLRSLSRTELDYVVRGQGGSKEHRRYRSEDVLRYAAKLVRRSRNA